MLPITLPEHDENEVWEDAGCLWQSPPSSSPATQWDQTCCLELLSLWKEKRMLTQLTTTFSVLKKVQQLLTKIQKSITFRKLNYHLIKCLIGTPRFWCFLHSSHHSSNPNKEKSVLTPFFFFYSCLKIPAAFWNGFLLDSQKTHLSTT